MPLKSNAESVFIGEGAGNYAFFMFNNEALIWCKVTAFYLLGRASAQGIIENSLEALFGVYRSDVEEIASIQFDSGNYSPWVTAANLPWI
jgi:hypothetical protein